MNLEPISVIGLGYVGLPVAAAFGQQRRVIAFDINRKRLEELRKGVDKTSECTTEELKDANLLLTDQPEDLQQASIHIIAVPTPINESKQPDLTPLLNATEIVGRILKAGDLVIYESTVYPAVPKKIVFPLLEKLSGLKYLSKPNSSNSKFEDFSKSESCFTVGYSPERINPGDKQNTFKTITKVVSGSTPHALDRVAELYGSVVTSGTHRASSIKVAEATKVIENAQRYLNIAFINELALIFDRLGVDTQDVLEAAGTKWNFLPFKPGLVGGHCIGVDPFYLTHRAERAGYYSQMILAGRLINDQMGVFVGRRTVQELVRIGKGSVGAKVLVLGLTFKEDCPDLRNSRVPDILEELNAYGCELYVHDPFCDIDEAREEYGVELVNLEVVPAADAILLAVAHKPFREWSILQWKKYLSHKSVVIDVKGSAPRLELEEAGVRVWRL